MYAYVYICVCMYIYIYIYIYIYTSFSSRLADHLRGGPDASCMV